MKSKKDFNYLDDYREYLRYYFAGLAMQGLLSSDFDAENSIDDTTDMAIELADSLLSKLSKPITE